jgi:AraC-like DNA-binding protein
MPVLPIPMIIALLLFGFLMQRMVARETHITILALIAACATQGAIIALVQHYGLLSIRPLQAILAMTIPPIAWAAFRNAAGGDVRLRSMLWHIIGPLLAIVCLYLKPFLLDALIPLSFAGYGITMLLHLWRGEDSLLHSRLESGGHALLAWRIIAVSLIASAFCDVAIAYGLAQGVQSVVLWIPSVVSSLSLLSLGILSLSNAIESRREHDTETLSEEDATRDQAIITRLDQYLGEHKPYLDPDLTLARLARKLVLPAKQLSAAVNRNKNENVSRFINRHRIEHACTLIAKGKSVTVAMFDSGFNTKSNFNREFQRIKNIPPSKWQGSLLNNEAKPPISVIQQITE